MTAGAKWDDLTLRLVSGLVMVTVGMGAVALGGIWFHILVALIVAVMVWEFVCLMEPGARIRPLHLGAIAGIAVFAAAELPPGLGLPLLLLPSVLGLGLISKGKSLYLAFSALILLAGFGMMALRDDFGFVWMLWLVLVVIVTDVLGYFAGRMLGGPKFWPRVSPKKTWSGTVAGWLGAGIVGAVFASVTQAGIGLVGVSVAAAMASQMGDIAESAIKRQAGVKDSSRLLPGHGGLLDRFDGMLGASVFIVVVGPLTAFPPGSGP